MNRLPEIKATYDWFFSHYQAEIAQMARLNDFRSMNQMEARRDILERGIFVLMFGQFEKAVTLKFDTALNNRTTNPDWNYRRGWDTSWLKGRKVPFDVKLAMVLDRQSPSFNQITTAYATRNHCAHGGTTNPVASIDALESDIYRWHGELRG